MILPIRNQIGNLTKLRIVELSLTSLALVTTTGVCMPPSALAQDRHISAKASKELPVVRSTALAPGIDVPWSQPVKIIDPFEGEYVGIFDKNYFYQRLLNTNVKVQVVSLWQRESVRFLLAYSDRDCYSGHDFFYSRIGRDCLGTNAALQLTNLWLKIGDRVFRLEGQDSRFQVNRELATALKNAPGENISIRLETESGEAVDSEIGKGTVQAWKAIY